MSGEKEKGREKKMVIKANVEKDAKKENSVVGRIFTSPHSGKIVFFNGGDKPSIGQVISIDEFEDKGRFMIAKKWNVAVGPESEKLQGMMKGRIEYAKGDDFKLFVQGLINRHERSEYVMAAFVEIPLVALENGVKQGDNSLIQLCDTFRNLLAENAEKGDVVSQATFELLDAAKEIFKRGGSDKKVMELRQFNELFQLIADLTENPGTWPHF